MALEERRHHRTLSERLTVAVPLIVVWSVGCVIMAIVASQPASRASELLMDPSFTLGSKWYTGLVSNLGILTWTVGAAAAFAGAWLCKLGGRHNARRFLLMGGIVGTMLLFDDLFMFHAVLLPAEFGIPKSVGQVLLAAAVVYWVVVQRHEVRRTHYHLLVACAIGLAISYLVDTTFAPLPGDGWNVVEDGMKFLAVLAWTTYFVITTRDISRSVFVDALLTWPDSAYQSVYEGLEEERSATHERPGSHDGSAQQPSGTGQPNAAAQPINGSRRNV